MKKLLFNVSCSLVFVVLANAFLASKNPYNFVGHGAAVLVGVALVAGAFFYFRHFVPLRRREPGFPFVYVEEDGTVRELSGDEIDYLSAEFSPGDGARPSIKTRYTGKNGWGDINGFIPRRRIPARIPIARCFSTTVTASPF